MWWHVGKLSPFRDLGDMTLREKVFSLILDFFHGDGEKAERWMATSNPLLGCMTPDDMIALGRGEKLLKWVRQSLAENK